MIRRRPRRKLIEKAIHKAKATKKGEQVIDLSPVTGVGIDGAYIIIDVLERIRVKREIYQFGQELRPMVSESVFWTALPPDRQRRTC